MIEMPELFERYMNLGKKALEEKHYEEARDNFEAAYELESSNKANVYLVKTLFHLKAYQEAYVILCEKKGLYRTNKKMRQLYFDILVQLAYFFEIEKFLVGLEGNEKKEYQKSYQVVKDYQLLTRKEEYDKLEKRMRHIADCYPGEQMLILKQLKFLPSDQLIELADKLLLNAKVSLFVKSEIIQQLSLIQCEKTFQLLTYQNQVKQVIPKKVLPLNDVYHASELLERASNYFEKKSPSLQKIISQTIKLHIGCLYPFHEEEMTPIDDWIKAYDITFTDQVNENLSDGFLNGIRMKQAILEQEIAKLLVVE